MAYQNPVKKIIPSRLETGVQQFLYKHVGKHIPGWMTPNQVTLIGALGGLLFGKVSGLWLRRLFALFLLYGGVRYLL